MKAEIITAPKIADTNTIVESVSCIVNLLQFIFTAPGSVLPSQSPGAVALHKSDILITRQVLGSMFYLVNISGKCLGSLRPVPAGIFAPVSYLLSERGIAWKEIYLAWLQVWHWSAFPVALFGKVRLATSYLLY